MPQVPALELVKGDFSPVLSSEHNDIFIIVILSFLSGGGLKFLFSLLLRCLFWLLVGCLLLWVYFCFLRC